MEAENDFMKLTGFAGKPEIAQGNRNLRIIMSMAVLSKTKSSPRPLRMLTKEFLMHHKFPFVSLHMDMSGNDLDVNVHPAKRRFVLPGRRRSMTLFLRQCAAR